MAAYVRETREVRRVDDNATEPVADNRRAATQFTVSNIIWYVAGLLESLLAIRFILALLGANPSNAFANFIYTLSYPFVAPFFSLFNYNFRYGVSMFESYTLVAMVVYAIVAYAIARLLTLNHPATDAY